MKAPVQTRNGALDLQLTTLIDVVFLLLIFFVWTSSFDKPEHDLASELTMRGKASSLSATTAPPPMFDEIEIRLGPTHGNTVSVSINQQQLASLSQLRTELLTIVKLGAQPAIIIQPDAHTQMAQAIEIYDLARALGFDQVMFAVNP